MKPLFRAFGACTLAALATACGNDVDEAGAKALWQRLHELDYRTWQRAPGWETPRSTIRPHGELAEIFINPVLDAARSTPGLTSWPDGSLIVKDSQNDGERSLVAALEKTGKSWYYAEWSASGDARYAGVPDVCTNCHDAGDDQLFSLALPR